MSSIYEKYGLKQVINTSGRMTILGVSTPRQDVIDAVDYGLNHYFEIKDLVNKTGAYIADLLNVEDAVIVSCASAGIAQSVAAVIVTGIVNSLIILGGWPLNLGSPYQRLLLIKTALVALMVMVALANRYAIVPAMSRVPALAQRGVVLACWLEVGLGVAVLLLVSLFATYAPV